MSVRALSVVFDSSAAVGSAYTVLLALADWADHNGWCYPSYDQIARKARVSRSTAKRAVAALVVLGELERRTRGKERTAADEDDEIPATVRVQSRNLYRIALLKPRLHKVGSISDHLPSAEGGPASAQPDDRQAGSLTHGGGFNDGKEVGSTTTAHIRNRPSDQTVSRPSAAAAAAHEENAAEIEAFRQAWNDALVDPIPPVDELTPERRRRVVAALAEYPLDAWRVIFARVAASSFLRGGGDRGFIATLWWLIAKPDHAIAVMEGQYDDAPRRKAVRL